MEQKCPPKCEQYDFDIDRIMVSLDFLRILILCNRIKNIFQYRDNDLKVMRLVKMWRNLTEDYKGK